MEKNAPPTAEIAMVFVQGFSWWGAIHAVFSERKTESAANRNVHQQMKLSENVI